MFFRYGHGRSGKASIGNVGCKLDAYKLGGTLPRGKRLTSKINALTIPFSSSNPASLWLVTRDHIPREGGCDSHRVY